MLPILRTTTLTLVLASASLMTLTHAHADTSYTVGQKLTAAQIAQLGTLKTVEIDGRSYKVLATLTNSSNVSATQLLGRNGVVGQSFHEVMVSGVAAETVKQKLAALIGSAQSVKHYESGNLSLLRFATIEQAAAALNTVKSALPDASVGLPITFNTAKPM